MASSTSRKKTGEHESLYQQAISSKRLRADPISCLEDLQKALDMVLNGYVLDRVSPKGQLIEVTEKHPEMAARLVKTKVEIMEWLRKSETQEITCTLIVPGLNLSHDGEVQVYNPKADI